MSRTSFAEEKIAEYGWKMVRPDIYSHPKHGFIFRDTAMSKYTAHVFSYKTWFWKNHPQGPWKSALEAMTFIAAHY